MTNYTDYLEQGQTKAKKVFDEHSAKADAVIADDLADFQREVSVNIPETFGQFLYASLGDRVTGQRSSVLNKTYLEGNSKGKKILDDAEKANVPIEEYVKTCKVEEDYYANRYARWSWRSRRDRNPDSYDKPQIYITTGRSFGVSYVTGKNGRMHTIYFGAGEAFKYLTQEHVDCVKNKLKHKCVQQFLDFRDSFVDGLKGLEDVLIPTVIPVNIGVLSIINKAPKITEGGVGYSRAVTSYILMDEVVDSEITHVLYNMRKTEVWDKMQNLNSCNVKADSTDSPSFISVMFLNINDEKQEIRILGNFDIANTGINHSLHRADKGDRTVEHHGPNVYRRSLLEYPSMSLYQRYSIVPTEGVILNMDQVLSNPVVYGELKKRIQFYRDMSLKLLEIKHDNATLYFMNGDI